MILYTTLATFAAVALGMALNASRAQVRGLSRELKKKTSLIYRHETQLLNYRAEVAGANDKAKTWENRGEELSKRLLVAENDLAAALQKLLTLEAKAANRRELNRLSKQRQRARRKAEKLGGGEQ
jgi:chromosome segregation ATPase